MVLIPVYTYWHTGATMCLNLGFISFVFWATLTAIAAEAEFEVRLVDGTSEADGRVEVFYHGEWGTVCDDAWDMEDAGVICRSLGYSDLEEMFWGGHFGEGSGPIHELDCQGDEDHVKQCSAEWGLSNCNHDEDVGVSCSNEDSKSFFAYIPSYVWTSFAVAVSAACVGCRYIFIYHNRKKVRCRNQSNPLHPPPVGTTPHLAAPGFQEQPQTLNQYSTQYSSPFSQGSTIPNTGATETQGMTNTFAQYPRQQYSTPLFEGAGQNTYGFSNDMGPPPSYESALSTQYTYN